MLTEIFRSESARACEQRAFVLRAVGIPSDVLMQEGTFLLFVPSESESSARDQLERYYAENTPVAPPPPSKLYDSAWIAPTLYGVLLVAIAFLAGRDTFSFDWYETGALSSSLAHDHEWWRAATALTLHVDHGHLIRNIGFGALFLYPAARMLGSGVAFASAVLAGVFGNLLDSVLMPQTHTAIGASTIVFAALGLLSAYSWRIRLDRRMRWAHRWAPLVIGIALLGLLGSGGENTDVLGHLTGFACGVLFAVGLAGLPLKTFDKISLQSIAPLLATATIGFAWFAAASAH